MKKLTALLLVLITALSLCACGVDSGDDSGSASPGGTGNVGVANPVTSATAQDVENELGVALTLPGRATDAVYQLIDHGDSDTKMGQCRFVLDGTECTYRAVKADGLKDISGMFYAWEKAGSCDIDGCPGNVRYNTGEEGVCFWYDEDAGLVYCISVETGAGEEYLVSLAEYLRSCADGQAPVEEVSPEQPDEQPSDEPVEQPPVEDDGDAADETA
ncbi:MAG: hypothetical protein IJP23_02400, partial [Oscillospiraceae bacterium]|nr:hypothetical protein [Oscillospiraceae bacterium]